MNRKRIIKALKLRLKNYELSQRIDDSIKRVRLITSDDYGFYLIADLKDGWRCQGETSIFAWSIPDLAESVKHVRMTKENLND